MKTRIETKAKVKSEHKRIAQLCDDESIRIDKLVWIGPALGDGWRPSDDLQELLETAVDDLPGLFGKKVHQRLADAIEECESEEVFSALNDEELFGFIAEVATPSRDGGTSYTWGICRTLTVYAETLDDLIKKAIEFKKRVAKEGEQAAKKPKAIKK